MLKVIGTGLSGLVGSRVVELLHKDFDFIDFSLDTKVDILNPQSISDAYTAHHDTNVVIHLAAFTDTNAAWAQRGDKSGLCYRLNVEGTRNILEHCKKYHKHLIYISTDFVFDGTKSGKYTETDTPNPIEWYGQTKYEGEKMVSEYSGSTIIRLAFPYRAKFGPKLDIVRKTIEAFKATKLYPQWTDHFTTPTFVDDIAYGFKYFFQNQPTGIFHLVGSSSQSPYDMSLAIAKTFNLDQNLIKPSTLAEYVASQPPGSRPWQKNLSLSNQKIKKLEINPKNLKQGLLEIKKQLM